MTDNSSSPVRPPVLDGKARKSSRAKPNADQKTTDAPKPNAASAEPAQPTTDKPVAKPSSGFGFFSIVLAAVSGAALAILIIVLLASTGTLNQLAPNANDVQVAQDNMTSQLDSLRGRIANLETSVEGQAQNIKSASENSAQSLAASAEVATDFDTTIAALTAQLDALEAEMAANQNANQNAIQLAISEASQGASSGDEQISALAAQLDNLSNRIEAVAAGASGEDAANLSNDIEQLLAQNSALREQLDSVATTAQTTAAELADQSSTAQQANQTLAQDLTQAQAKIAQLETDIASLLTMRADLQTEQASVSVAAKLPIALSSFQSGVTSGQAFDQSLQSLSALLPELAIPTAVTDFSAQGLPTAQALQDRFQSIVPDVLAKLPVDPEANLADRLTQSLQQAFAMRDISSEADNPQALVGVAETALGNGDFAAAKAALENLPTDMQTVAADILSTLDAHVAAQNLIAEAQLSVLNLTTQTQGANE